MHLEKSKVSWRFSYQGLADTSSWSLHRGWVMATGVLFWFLEYEISQFVIRSLSSLKVTMLFNKKFWKA